MDFQSIEEGDVILQVDYEDEAERKRVEYAVNNAEGVEADVVNGFVRALSGDSENLTDLLSQVNSKAESEFNYGVLTDKNFSLGDSEYTVSKISVENNQEHLDFYMDGISNGALDRGDDGERLSQQHVKIYDRKLGNVHLSFDVDTSSDYDLEVHTYGKKGSGDSYHEALISDIDDRFGVDSVEEKQFKSQSEEI